MDIEQLIKLLAEPKPPHVITAISDIGAAMAKKPIVKTGTGSNKGRELEDIMNALAPLLPEHNLTISPRNVVKTVSPHITKEGDVERIRYYVHVMVEYDFTSKIDGSIKPVMVPGESMDGGDKSTIKAMSNAYKIACIQTFCIPTERDPEVLAKEQEEAFQAELALRTAEADEIIANIKNIDDYNRARELMKPVRVRMAAVDVATTMDYDNKMIALKEHFMPKAAKTVDQLREEKR